MEIPKGTKRGYTMLRTKDVVLAALTRNPDAQRRLRSLARENFTASHPEQRRRYPGVVALRRQIPELPLALAAEAAVPEIPCVPLETPIIPLSTLLRAQEIMPPPTQTESL